MKYAFYCFLGGLATYGAFVLGWGTYVRVVQHDQLWAYVVQVERARQESLAAKQADKPGEPQPANKQAKESKPAK